MTTRKPGIIFMGTPRFAVPSLEILLQNGFPVKAVVTAVDKKSGRGLKVNESPVKLTALASGIPVIQPSSLKDDAFAGKLRELSADLFVVVAFRMLPEKVWSIPLLGTVNLHASLLPLYRGAAPINHAIINGEKITGVTTFLIEKEIDTGNILLQEKTKIGNSETAGELHDRLMVIGAGLLLKTVTGIMEGKITPMPQDEFAFSGNLPKAPKISKSDCRINWSDPADRIFDFVRGLSPYPAAWTRLFSGDKEINLKILEVEKNNSTHSFPPGKVTSHKDNLVIAAGNGFVIAKFIKAEGRKAMASSDFLRGFRLDKDSICR